MDTKNLIYIILSGFLLTNFAVAEPIKFPKEELARESVYPKFDNPEAVKNRRVITAKKFEISGHGGFTLNDVFFSPVVFGLAGTYHLNEISGIQLEGTFFSRALSGYAKELKIVNNVEQDYDLAPNLDMAIIANYEWTPYYGKISLTKQGVMNLAVRLTGGLGIVGIDGTNKLAFSLGIGEKFYIGRKWGIFVNIRSLIYTGPNLTSLNLGGPITNPGVSTLQPPSAFEQSLLMKLNMTFGFTVLL